MFIVYLQNVGSDYISDSTNVQFKKKPKQVTKKRQADEDIVSVLEQIGEEDTMASELGTKESKT